MLTSMVGASAFGICVAGGVVAAWISGGVQTAVTGNQGPEDSVSIVTELTLWI
jgi:hypothetical protein